MIVLSVLGLEKLDVGDGKPKKSPENQFDGCPRLFLYFCFRYDYLISVVMILKSSGIKVVLFNLDRTLISIDPENLFLNYLIPAILAGHKDLSVSKVREIFYGELAKLSADSEVLYFSLEAISRIVGRPYDELPRIFDDICRVLARLDSRTIGLIENLKKRGIRIVVLADTDTAIAIYKIRHANLCRLIDEVYSSTEIFGRRKPSQTNLKVLELLRDLDYADEPSKVLVVGDDVERDHRAPKSIGMDAIPISKTEIPSVETISELEEFLEIIK